jgi:hypothetical protein
LLKSHPILDRNGTPVTVHDYCVFGLKVRSELELPELFEDDSDAAPDVTIRVGAIESESDREGLHADEGGLVLVVPQIARFRIADGATIVVEPQAGVPGRNVRLFLLGSAFGALLHQRGLLPLHANAIEIDGKAVAFMGPSGAGKSTLAAWFHDRGFRVLADDVCVVGFDLDGCPYAAPGLPRLRLWADALDLMGRERRGLVRSYLHDADEKFDLLVDPASATRSKISLAAIYLLDRAEEFSIAPLTGIEAADAVFANTYRGEYLAKTSGHKQHWESAIRLVRATPVFRAIRQWDLKSLEDQCSPLLHHAQEYSCKEPSPKRTRD